MKRLLSAGVPAAALFAAALIVPASAADIYRGDAAPSLKDGPAPHLSWTGFYIGANGGYAWNASGPELYSNLAVGDHSVSPEGGFGGAQLGYNVQGFLVPRGVIGIEADIQGGDISGTSKFEHRVAGVLFSSGTGVSKTDWFGTVRGRLGYAFDRTLVYATGGLAYGDVQNSVSFSPGHISYKFNDTVTGYVVGGGLEHKIDKKWSIKAEYQYINLGEHDLSSPTMRNWSSYADAKLGDNDIHTARVGLNYSFSRDSEPLK